MIKKTDRESLLMALDQLDQTMDVMRQVVNRLKRNVQQTQNINTANNELPQGITEKAIVLH